MFKIIILIYYKAIFAFGALLITIVSLQHGNRFNYHVARVEAGTASFSHNVKCGYFATCMHACMCTHTHKYTHTCTLMHNRCMLRCDRLEMNKHRERLKGNHHCACAVHAGNKKQHAAIIINDLLRLE